MCNSTTRILKEVVHPTKKGHISCTLSCFENEVANLVCNVDLNTVTATCQTIGLNTITKYSPDRFYKVLLAIALPDSLYNPLAHSAISESNFSKQFYLFQNARVSNGIAWNRFVMVEQEKELEMSTHSFLILLI